MDIDCQRIYVKEENGTFEECSRYPDCEECEVKIEDVNVGEEFLDENGVKKERTYKADNEDDDCSYLIDPVNDRMSPFLNKDEYSSSQLVSENTSHGFVSSSHNSVLINKAAMCQRNQTLEWSSEQDEILIDFVKNHELMYNVHLKDFRKTHLKNILWHEIGRILKKTGTECSKRWAYVRDYYVRRRGKQTTGSSSEAAMKRSELLSFLDSIPPSKRSNITNIDDTNNIENYTDDGINDKTDHTYTEEVQNGNIRRSEKRHLMNEISATQSSVGNSNNTYPPEVKRKNPPHFASKFSNSDERIKLLRQIARKHQEQDENDLFFASMAKIVKRFPHRDQAEIRMQIGNLVGMAEIDYLSKS